MNNDINNKILRAILSRLDSFDQRLFGLENRILKLESSTENNNEAGTEEEENSTEINLGNQNIKENNNKLVFTAEKGYNFRCGSTDGNTKPNYALQFSDRSETDKILTLKNNTNKGANPLFTFYNSGMLKCKEIAFDYGAISGNYDMFFSNPTGFHFRIGYHDDDRTEPHYELTFQQSMVGMGQSGEQELFSIYKVTSEEEEDNYEKSIFTIKENGDVIISGKLYIGTKEIKADESSS